MTKTTDSRRFAGVEPVKIRVPRPIAVRYPKNPKNIQLFDSVCDSFCVSWNSQRTRRFFFSCPGCSGSPTSPIAIAIGHSSRGWFFRVRRFGKRARPRLTNSVESLDRFRIVRQLSRPSSRVVQAIAKRFQAACDEVGPGEVGDARHIESVRRAFNAYDYDPWGEPVRRRPPSPESPRAADDTFAVAETSGDQAFVATTPGAVGHAALLNLRHSFLWLKVDLEAGASVNLSAAPGDSLHPAGFVEAKAAAAIAERAALALAPVPVAGGAQTARAGALRGPAASAGEGDASSSAIGAAETVLVMEPDIKAHFVISRPTPAYARLVDALPKTFVGTHQALVRLVDFMCERMNGSFRESGMSVPPWRKNKAILSKWFLPTATSRSHPTTPSGSPERISKPKKQDSGRRMSFDMVGGGEVVGVGVTYRAGGAMEEHAPPRGVAVGAGA